MIQSPYGLGAQSCSDSVQRRFIPHGGPRGIKRSSLCSHPASGPSWRRSIGTSPGLCKPQSHQGRAKDVQQLEALWIERAPDALAAALQHMRINHGGAHIFMPQEFLHSADVVAIFQEMRRKRVPTRIVTRLILRRWPRSVTRTIPALDRPWRLSGGYGAKPPTVLWSSSPRAYSGPSPWGGLTLSRAPRCAILPRPPCASMPCWSGAICSIITTPC
jgi:hypothetical protein